MSVKIPLHVLRIRRDGVYLMGGAA
jgi:hypothetical protein